MKAKIFVTLKPSVLDPQGKYFEVVIDGSLSKEEARAAIERMARDVLANPIIEDYRVELDSDS